MKSIDVKIKRASVVDFYTKTFLISLEIIYEVNGVEKKIIKDTFLQNIDELVPTTIREIREKEKLENSEDEGEDFLDNVTIINMGDTEVIENKLSHFLGKVKDSVNQIRTHGIAAGYINKVNSIKGMEVVFNVR